MLAGALSMMPTDKREKRRKKLEHCQRCQLTERKKKKRSWSTVHDVNKERECVQFLCGCGKHKHTHVRERGRDRERREGRGGGRRADMEVVTEKKDANYSRETHKYTNIIDTKETMQCVI